MGKIKVKLTYVGSIFTFSCTYNTTLIPAASARAETTSSPFLRELLLSVRLTSGPPQQVAGRNGTVFAKKQLASLTLSLTNDKGYIDNS